VNLKWLRKTKMLGAVRGAHRLQMQMRRTVAADVGSIWPLGDCLQLAYTSTVDQGLGRWTRQLNYQALKLPFLLDDRLNINGLSNGIKMLEGGAGHRVQMRTRRYGRSRYGESIWPAALSA
jgi:hypothetical protein